MKDKNGAYTDFSNYISSNPADGALVMATMLKLYRMSKQFKKADVKKWRTRILDTSRALKKDGIGLSEGAEAQFDVALESYDKFKKIKIPANPAQQAAKIKENFDQLSLLDNELKKVIQYDDGHYVVKASHLSAEARELLIQKNRKCATT